MRSAPTFSIVVPTRNRAALLGHALRTALGQTVDDIEVVVCDNASDGATRAVVDDLADERVHYLRSDRVLPAHENWELAVAHARGEWVTLLPDDDGFVPSLLERASPLLNGHVRAVAWGECTYAHPEARAPWFEPAEVNRLVVEPYTGRVEEVDGRAELARIFERRERRLAPGVVTALVHRSALDRLRAVTGSVFGPPDPFLRAAAAYLALEPAYLALDLPLTARGISGATITFGFLRNERDGHEVVREFDAPDLFVEVPLRSRTTANVIAESLLRAKRQLPEQFEGIDLDPVAYFVSCRLEIDGPGRRDDGGEARAEWQAVMDEQPRAVRSAVGRQLARRRARASLVGAARAVARATPPIRRLHRVIRRSQRRSELLLLHGDDWGFADLPGAARHLDEHVLPAPDRVPLDVR